VRAVFHRKTAVTFAAGLAVLAGLSFANLAASAPLDPDTSAATAAAPTASVATSITYVCVNKSTGQLFYLASCNNSQTTVSVTSTATQFKACYLLSNGVTRKVSASTTCNNKPRTKEGTIPKVPADSDSLYFCVDSSGTMYFTGTTEPTCPPRQFAVVIGPHNRPPTVANDAYSVNEDNTLTVAAPGVLGNDSDPDGDAITAQLDTAPSHAASFALNADGSYTYVHDGSETTSDSFTYKANDGALDSNVATVTITINPVDDSPIANNDSATVNEGGTLNVPAPGVLGNDTDAENDSLTATLVSGPSHASSFTLNADGSYTYVHDGSETTSDSFTYKANDGALDSNVATVTITINPVNDSPIAFDDGYEVY
jgi:VCBS repeat-containing protein